MTFLRTIISVFAVGAAVCSYASAPQGYFSALDGKSGAALLDAVKQLAAGHRTVEYNTETWPAFVTTDVRTVNGREAWFDMYSNNIVYLPDHASLNIEHSVANSWWGGKNGSKEAYSDLFHLNPSDQNANNKKSNYPPAELADARLFDNGLFRVGTPVEGQGGGAKTAFEPADEYKGDFARAYLYIFASYPDIPWKESDAFVCDANGRLLRWTADLLLKWNRQDPVDSKELSRNEEVYRIQGNRNPFIDYPELAEYIWGAQTGRAFELGSAATAVAADRPEAPRFRGARTVGVNTYTRRWWDGFTQEILADEGTLMVSIDGRDFYPASGELSIDAAENGSESHTYLAYTEKQINGLTLRSSVSRLDIKACDPDVTDYSAARWSRVTAASGFNPGDGPFVILSSNTLHSMSATGGSSSTAFMESAGFVDFDNEGIIEILPFDAALIDFEKVGEDKYRLNVKDIHGQLKGSWNATAKNKMKLDNATYTPGTGHISDTDAFVWTFDSFGSLQFNKTQPRFLNYESSQTPVYIYRFVDFDGGFVGVEKVEENPWAVGIADGELILPAGTMIFDLTGRRVSPRALRHGIYIVTDGARSEKIII